MVDNDINEYQLSLRIFNLGAGTGDELYIVEAEAMNYESSPIKVTLVTLKMSLVGDFKNTIAASWLKCGSGPVHISWQHLIAIHEDAESEGKEENVKLLSISGKHSALKVAASFTHKKVKLAVTEDVDEDEDEDDDDKNMKILVMKKLKEKLN